MKDIRDYEKFPYHGVGFTGVPLVHEALKVLTKHGLYKLEDNHAVVPTLNATRERVLRDVRNAIVGSEVKLRDEDMTKDGQYRSDWIVLDDHALRICALRRGGYGAILEARFVFEKERTEWRAIQPALDRKVELIQSALAKLTPEEKRALGF